jgi:DNA-binding transcriptional ArsR family regulator
MHPSTSDPRTVKAYTHPLRVRILELLETRTASPRKLADELGVSIGSVSYHVRQLVDIGRLRLVKRIERRGAIEHFYTATAPPTLSDEAWGQLPNVVKNAVLGSAIAKAGAHAVAAAREGGFERADIHFSRTSLLLDRQAWTEVANDLAGMLARLEKLGAESAERLTNGAQAEAPDATVIMMLFEGPAKKG